MVFQPGQSGNPAGKKPGTLNKATRLKNFILDLLEERADEIKTLDIDKVLKVGAGFVPKSVEVQGEMTHHSFIENMIKQAEKIEKEEDVNTD